MAKTDPPMSTMQVATLPGTCSKTIQAEETAEPRRTKAIPPDPAGRSEESAMQGREGRKEPREKCDGAST